MSSVGSLATNPLGLGGLAAILLLTSAPPSARAAQETTPRTPGLVSEERVELFLALLKRRAQQALEAHRAPPPPLMSASTDLSQGYESNVLLDGDKRGDSFTQETASVSLRPRVKPWVSGELAYNLLNTHYTDLRDANLFMNTITTALLLQPHRRVRCEVGYEFSNVEFPFDTSNTFLDHRTSASTAFTLTRWLTHKWTWTYQVRNYDSRLARDGAGNDRPNDERQDERHILSQELALRVPKTSVKLGGQFYRNFSNDLSQDFYDWEDYQLQGVVSRVFNPQWIGLVVGTYERRNYQRRSVPAINMAERDTLYTVAGSVIFFMNEHAQVTYSLTYRYQDSNDPRLDFLDWINQVRFGLEF